MTTEFIPELVGLVQSIAVAYGVWRGTDNALADFVVKAMERGEFSQAELDTVRRLLHSQPLQAALAARDVALFRRSDGLFRLIDQQPSSLKGAMLRVAHHPGPNCCRYCLLKENMSELEPEFDAKNEPINGSFLHKHCQAAWRKLRIQVMR